MSGSVDSRRIADAVIEALAADEAAHLEQVARLTGENTVLRELVQLGLAHQAALLKERKSLQRQLDALRDELRAHRATTSGRGQVVA